MPWLTGYPRDKVEWFPTIDEKKCVSCGMCMNCGKNVYDWVAEKNKPESRGENKVRRRGHAREV